MELLMNAYPSMAVMEGVLREYVDTVLKEPEVAERLLAVTDVAPRVAIVADVAPKVVMVPLVAPRLVMVPFVDDMFVECTPVALTSTRSLSMFGVLIVNVGSVDVPPRVTDIFGPETSMSDALA
jgi:hypothetical protein